MTLDPRLAKILDLLEERVTEMSVYDGFKALRRSLRDPAYPDQNGAWLDGVIAELESDPSRPAACPACGIRTVGGHGCRGPNAKKAPKP